MPQAEGKSRKTTAAAQRADARRTGESESTVRVYLKRSVGQGRGPLFGPGWANVPKALAESLKLSGATSEGPEGSEPEAQDDEQSEGVDEQDEQDADGDEEEEAETPKASRPKKKARRKR